MIRRVWGWKRIAGPLIALYPRAYSVMAMESSSAFATKPRHPRHSQHSQPPQRYNKMIVDSASVGAPREGGDDHGMGVSKVGAVINTASIVLRADAGSQPPTAPFSVLKKPKQGSFGGAGSARQNSSYSLQFPSSIAGAGRPPDIIFGTLDYSDLNATNSHTDFPQLSNNVDQAQPSILQPVTQSWDEQMVGNDEQGKDSLSAEVLEFESLPPMEMKGEALPNVHLQVPPLLDVKGGDSPSVHSQVPPTLDVKGGDSPSVHSQVHRPLEVKGGYSPSVHSKAPPPLELKGANVPNVESQVPQKRPSGRDLGSEQPAVGWARESKVIASTSQSPLMDDAQFPSLSASSVVPRRKASGKGGHRSTEQVQTAHTRLPVGSQEPGQRSEGKNAVSVQAGWDKVGQTRHSGNYDGRKDGIPGFDRQSDGRRGGRQGGEWRDGRQGRERRDGGWQGVDQRDHRRDGWQAGERRDGWQAGERRDGWQAGERRNGRQGNEPRDYPRVEQDPIESLGRLLTSILRHRAPELNLKIRSDGFVVVQDILKLPMRTRSRRLLSSHSVDDVQQAAEQDKKNRLGIVEENGHLLIRANQGHTIQSVDSEDLLKPIVSASEVPACVHGTYRRYLNSIFREGLKRQTRNHVHFATGHYGMEGVISGMRNTAEVVIRLNVEKALSDGMKLYISENGVILTEGFNGVVPVAYFAEVLKLPELTPIAVPVHSPLPSK